MVELVVVLVILAVLVGISLTLLNPKKYIDQAKDAKRAHDLTQIQSALDTYYNDYNYYPKLLSQLNSDQTKIYMKDIPTDPDTGFLYPYEINADETYPQWNILFAKVSTRSNMWSTCPLDQFSDCIPPNYDSSYICVLSGKIDCTYVKSVEVLPPIVPTGVPTPTPTSILNPTPTTPFGGPTNTPTPTGFLTPTPTGTLSPTPTPIFTPTPTLPPPTPTPCVKIYACRPTCNQLDTPADDGYCSSNCDGAC
ncbi:MAG: hypothetical protein AAB662_03145, partial [Patescibacteria group bacterium]